MDNSSTENVTIDPEAYAKELSAAVCWPKNAALPTGTSGRGALYSNGDTIFRVEIEMFGTAAEQDAATMREAKFLQRELQEVIVAMILQGCTESLRHDNMIVYPEEQKWGISSQNGKHVWRKDGEPKVAKKVKLIVRLLSPYTRTEIPRGIIEFKGHQEPSIEMSRPSWEELRQETARLPRVKQVAHIIPAAGDGAATAAVTSKDKGANSATPSVGSVTSKVAVRKHSSSGAEGTHTEEIAHFSPRRTRSQSAAMKASEAVAQLPPMKRRKTSSRAVAREQEKDDGPEVMDDNSTKISEVDSFSPRRTRSVTLAKAAASTSDNNVSDEEDFFVSPVKYVGRTLRSAGMAAMRSIKSIFGSG